MMTYLQTEYPTMFSHYMYRQLISYCDAWIFSIFLYKRHNEESLSDGMLYIANCDDLSILKWLNIGQ